MVIPKTAGQPRNSHRGERRDGWRWRRWAGDETLDEAGLELRGDAARVKEDVLLNTKPCALGFHDADDVEGAKGAATRRGAEGTLKMRKSTKAVPSLRRDSPSMIVPSRTDAPTSFRSATTATGSVALMRAPNMKLPGGEGMGWVGWVNGVGDS